MIRVRRGSTRVAIDGHDPTVRAIGAACQALPEFSLAGVTGADPDAVSELASGLRAKPRPLDTLTKKADLIITSATGERRERVRAAFGPERVAAVDPREDELAWAEPLAHSPLIAPFGDDASRFEHLEVRTVGPPWRRRPATILASLILGEVTHVLEHPNAGIGMTVQLTGAIGSGRLVHAVEGPEQLSVEAAAPTEVVRAEFFPVPGLERNGTSSMPSRDPLELYGYRSLLQHLVGLLSTGETDPSGCVHFRHAAALAARLPETAG